ncbi:MAG: tetratricopeptide repeat protein [Elusimicrobiota bacterium]
MKNEKLQFVKLFTLYSLLFTAFSGCNFDYYFNRGVNAKDPQSKIKYFSKAIEKWNYRTSNKNKSNVYINRGVAYAIIEDYDGAISDFTKALTFDEDPSAYYNRALLFTKQKKYKNALDDVNNALRLNPLLENAYTIRGELYQKMGKVKRAKKDFLTVSEISKSRTPYLEGLKYFNNETYSESIKFFTKSINLNPCSAETYNIRGLAYLKIGKTNDATNDFNKAIEIDKKFIDAYNNRGTLYAGKCNYVLAMADFNKIIELQPNSPEPYYNIGLLYQVKSDYANSIKYFTKAINYSKKNPNDMAYYSRGYSFYVLENHAAAIKDFSTALKLNPRNSEANSYREVAIRKRRENERYRNSREIVGEE